MPSRAIRRRADRWVRRPRPAAVVRWIARRDIRASRRPDHPRARLAVEEARTERHRLDGAAQAHQPRATVTPPALLIVFVITKMIALAGHHVPLSWWTPVAYL